MFASLPARRDPPDSGGSRRDSPQVQAWSASNQSNVRVTAFFQYW